MDKKIEQVRKIALKLDDYELSGIVVDKELYVLIKDGEPVDYRFVNDFDDITHDISAKYIFADTFDELLTAVTEKKSIFEETVRQLHVLLKMEKNANSDVVTGLIDQYNRNIGLLSVSEMLIERIIYGEYEFDEN